MSISFRKLAASDSARYREIRLESLKAHPESFGSSFEAQSKLPKLMFEQAMEQPVDDRFVIGAFDGEVLIGICGFLPFAPDDFLVSGNAGTIIQMVVQPAYRGRKLGLGLVDAVLAEAFKNPDMEKVVLGVKEGNLSAIRVYEQAGFRTYKTATSEAEGTEGDRLMIIDARTFQEAVSLRRRSLPGK
jgi:ribosomal-protein-alanine N-acetyltransferase